MTPTNPSAPIKAKVIKPTWALDPSEVKVTCSVCGKKVLVRQSRRFIAKATRAGFVITCEKGLTPHTKKD